MEKALILTKNEALSMISEIELLFTILACKTGYKQIKDKLEAIEMIRECISEENKFHSKIILFGVALELTELLDKMSNIVPSVKPYIIKMAMISGYLSSLATEEYKKEA